MPDAQTRSRGQPAHLGGRAPDVRENDLVCRRSTPKVIGLVLSPPAASNALVLWERGREESVPVADLEVVTHGGCSRLLCRRLSRDG